MARLNEPPAVAPALVNSAAQPGAESIDAVKRRFIRQNRDLAKNNSNQSLRIRSLELDISRLHTDNLGLRERVLQLENDFVTAGTGRAPGDAVRRVREELQAKLAELSGLVEGIDALAATAGNNETSVPRARKLLEGQWRERQPLTESMRENSMPTIAEDKQYPRRTLTGDEIQAIRLSDHSSNESPDLGPPPIAHFDYEDPIKHVSPSANRLSSRYTEDEEELPASLSVNLETRRRRKDGQPKLEIRRHSVASQSPKKDDAEASTMLRTGAKRKLADRDLDKPTKPPPKGDFTFSRKLTASDSKTAVDRDPSESAGASIVQRVEGADSVLGTPPRPARRVLGDKSVNMSPRKAPIAPEKAGKDVTDKPSESAAPRPASSAARKRRVSAIPQPLQHEDILPSVELAPPPEPCPGNLAPKTPAPPPDFFSPTPSEPLAARLNAELVRAGTPPPADLSTLSLATDGGTRPSRRARAAVNYAEPSLNAKIRRPGKAMVDAVTGLVDLRRAMSVAVSDRKVGVPRTVVVKREAVEDEHEGWRDLPSAEEVVAPGSPLGAMGAADSSSDLALMPDNMTATADVQPPPGAPSAASATISALMAGGRQRRRRESSQLPLPEEPLGTDLATKLTSLDIYDFKESSSPGDAPLSAESAASGRSASTHRRHSSVPKDVRVGERRSAASAAAGHGASLAQMGEGGRPERAASRRRSMMV
ncbi:hypothetical protein LTR53_007927 [Teratosphaeriaceae sp. CCFEE 6253]|nr:hypothetical protein LTR53_007927 [Teratosphaeriaceae sp. CCFEE 6253]